MHGWKSEPVNRRHYSHIAFLYRIGNRKLYNQRKMFFEKKCKIKSTKFWTGTSFCSLNRSITPAKISYQLIYDCKVTHFLFVSELFFKLFQFKIKFA